MVLVATVALSACGGGDTTRRPTSPVIAAPRNDGPPPPEIVAGIDLDSIPDAVPKLEPLSRYGNPETYQVNGRQYRTLKSSEGFEQRGIASWYGSKFHGLRTSSGEAYDMYKMTAAHTTLPLPSYAEVTNLENGRRVIVKVNDRGPFHANRVMDLSYVAARKLGVLQKGTAFVHIRTVSGPRGDAQSRTPAPAPSESLALYLQVGAFQDRANAQALIERLRQAVTYDTRIAPANVNGQAVYRVQVGPVADVKAADNAIAQLGQSGINEYRFVSE
ncbi:MAG: septal ring lytic transglycosylase RlpA family protein [Gammaproteobacteria bacterium]|nr:septal ring lytic transglycosylase RlpA family protein [Gammaproteobacteria bacterium]